MGNAILLENRKANLENQYQRLHRELKEVDSLLYNIGFPEGLKSLKEVAEEMIYTKSFSDLTDEDEN